MPDYLLRVEAVNLGEVTDDTDDLSTRRGGGLLALNAVRQMTETLPADLRTRLESVATGASVGLFAFTAVDQSDAARVERQVRDHFQTGTLEYEQPDGSTGHLRLSVGTFVANVVPRTPDHRADVELATAANRWQHLQKPTVSLFGLEERADGECYYDCVRPRVRGLRLPKDNEQKDSRYDVSVSVEARHQYGRGRRQQFYEGELGRPVGRGFTDEFTEIGDRYGLTEDQAPTNTADKLAVLYVDGNKFGAVGREKLAAGLKEYENWSKQLQEHHKKLLLRLLDETDKDQAWRTTKNPKKQTEPDLIRLETLLWGGDEIIWVVPGWKGWELAAYFFAADHTIGGQPVTYSAGLVFCGTKTPVQNVVKLARRLGDVAKGVGGGHRLAYEVLESFDDITSDFDDHRRKWLPSGLQDGRVDPLTIDPARLKELLPHLRRIAGSDDFPLRQLYMLLAAWRKGQSTATFEKRLNASGVATELEAVRGGLGDLAWLHLLHILPYIPEGAT